jgi:hypothetical protein
MDALDHLAQEGLAFCLYCGGELAPTGEAKHGRCVDCGTAWDRVYSRECPGCGDGWVHLHYPDRVYQDPDLCAPGYAHGYGWCDACDAHICYRWSYGEAASLVVLEAVTGPSRAGRGRCGEPAEVVEAS